MSFTENFMNQNNNLKHIENESLEDIQEEINRVNFLCEQLESYIKGKNSDIGLETKNRSVSSNTRKGPSDLTYSNRSRAEIKTAPSSERMAQFTITKDKSADNREIIKEISAIRKSPKNEIFERLYKEKENKMKLNEKIQQKQEQEKNKNKLNKNEVDSMLTRFKYYQVEKESKIQQMKRKIINKEEQNFKPVPEISLNSKKLQINTEEDFLTRMEKLREQSEIKKKEMIEKELKRKNEEEMQIIEEARSRHKKRKEKNCSDEKSKSNCKHREFREELIPEQFKLNENQIANNKPRKSIEEDFMILKHDPIIKDLIRNKIRNSKKDEI
jgi:hypothetical protein